MNDRQRATFMHVVEMGSFSKVAQEDFVTPQSVAQQVRRLEEELGVALFERTARGVTPTQAGREFYEGCKDIDQAMSQAIARCRAVGQATKPSVTMRAAMGGHYSLGLISKIMPFYIQQHPEVSVRYVDPGHTSDVTCLLNRSCDIIETVQPQCPDVEFLPLYRSRRCCMVPPSNPLAAKTRIGPNDLRDQTAYVFSLKWAADLQRYLEQFLPGYKLHELTGPFETTVAQGPEASHAVYLLPEQIKDRFSMVIPIPFDADVFTDYGIAYRNDATPCVLSFLELASREYGKIDPTEQRTAPDKA